MISHAYVGVTDFERAVVFYSAVMEALGFLLKFCERERPWAGWMPTSAAQPLFLIGPPGGRRCRLSPRACRRRA